MKTSLVWGAPFDRLSTEWRQRYKPWAQEDGGAGGNKVDSKCRRQQEGYLATQRLRQQEGGGGRVGGERGATGGGRGRGPPPPDWGTGTESVEGGAHRAGEDWVWTPIPSEPRRSASGMRMSAILEVTPSIPRTLKSGTFVNH